MEEYPQQYARAIRGLPEPHPEIAHTALAHVLTKLADPHKNSSTVSDLARACLVDPYKTPFLHDALMDEGHPMTHEYNWKGVPRGLELQHIIRRAAEDVAKHSEDWHTADAVISHAIYAPSYGVYGRSDSAYATLLSNMPKDISEEEFRGTLRRRQQRLRNRGENNARREDMAVRREAGLSNRGLYSPDYKRRALRTLASLRKDNGGRELHPIDRAERFLDVQDV